MLEIKPLDVGPAAIPAVAGATAPIPGSTFDVLKWLPVLLSIGQAIAAGTGSFKTWTPWGDKWITVSDKAPTP